jgi:hypothetical protein
VTARELTLALVTISSPAFTDWRRAGSQSTWNVAWLAQSVISRARSINSKTDHSPDTSPVMNISLPHITMENTKGEIQMKIVQMITIGVIALGSLIPTTSDAQVRQPSNQEIIIHGFRSPSIGVELRRGWFGVHGGFYPTIISFEEGGAKNNTWFLKSGVTAYVFRVSTGGSRKSEVFVSASALRGLNHGWKNAGQIEPGFRWAVTKQMDLRVGASFLVGEDRHTHINPTIGLSWTFPNK